MLYENEMAFHRIGQTKRNTTNLQGETQGHSAGEELDHWVQLQRFSKADLDLVQRDQGPDPGPSLQDALHWQRKRLHFLSWYFGMYERGWNKHYIKNWILGFYRRD